MQTQLLSHIEQIKSKVELMNLSARSHALLINGPAGYGKSEAVRESLVRTRLKFERLGSYSTPLNLYNFLHTNSKKICVLDDVAGLFYDRAAMAILKSATWSSPGGRMIGWGSTTTKAAVEEFEFRGKLVFICNSFPMTPDALAIKSRSLTHQFQISVSTAKQLLREAAADTKWFENTRLAKMVAEFLCENLSEDNLEEVSYRTLHIGYDAAMAKPNEWKALLGSMIHSSGPKVDPLKLVKELARKPMKVEEQARIFEEMTGFKRRTFFKYRKHVSASR